MEQNLRLAGKKLSNGSCERVFAIMLLSMWHRRKEKIGRILKVDSFGLGSKNVSLGILQALAIAVGNFCTSITLRYENNAMGRSQVGNFSMILRKTTSSPEKYFLIPRAAESIEPRTRRCVG